MKRTLASWLYQVLFECRNDFLHGNPVERSNLVLSTPQRTIFEYAAPLYRIARTAFLPLTHAEPMPSADDPKAFGADIADRMDFMLPQKKRRGSPPRRDTATGRTRRAPFQGHPTSALIV
ncbi:hypothetical protein [Acidiphilium acidophilum]|uniref:hypothetical protein n=1 Tax=Acidiphilium acidophilum TaxID=76588 RepID=UPI002E8E6899|nr:hypothetical protein [Acidiphilium acidophilum]